MITRIKLTNWKSHLNTELSFSPGVNALIGIMGSGKTSVMQGIAFALFGTFSGLSSRKLSLDNLIMNKPQEKDSASVELEFVLNGKKYTIRRTIRKGKGSTEAEIREDGKLLEVNPKGVTREVERILQMDYDLFQRAVYSEQNSLEYFLQIPKGKRMQQIDSMLKLDMYEKARESAVSIRNRLAERRKEMLKVIEDMKGQKLDERIVELEKEVKKRREERKKLEKKAEETEKKRKALSEKVVEYEAEKERMNDISKRAEALNSRILELRKQIGKRAEKLRGVRISREVLEKLLKETANLEVGVEEKESEIRALRDAVSSKNSRMVFLRDQIKEAKLKLSGSKEKEMEMKRLEKFLGEEPEKKLGKMLSGVEKLRKRLYTLEAEKNEVERSLAELKEAGEKCPVCESNISRERKTELIENRTRRVGEIEVKISELRKMLSEGEEAAEEFRKKAEKYTEMKRELKDLDALKEKIRKNEGEISMLRKEVERIAVSIKEKEKERGNLARSLEKLKLRKSRMETLIEEKEELENLKTEVREIEKEKSSLEKIMKETERKLKEMDIKSMRSELQELVRLSGELETKLRDLGEMLEDKLSLLRELEEQKRTFLRYRGEAKKYEEVTESMNRFIAVLKNTQNQLRDEFLKTVNYIMNNIWSELYPYGDFSGIRMAVEGDYVLQLKGTRGWVNVDLVSGGERSLACLALRIAFSLAFTPNLRWLILDEPTHNLDTNAIEHFGGVLRDRMENIIDQVFLITHEERLSDYITGSVYRLERDKESDGVTKVAGG